jgi:hypothetical protein
MESTINIYELFSIMMDHNVVLIYHGNFDQDMIKSVLGMTERKLNQEKVDENVKKRLFNVMIEGLQNIAKHQMVNDTHYPFLLISKDEASYHILTGNYISNSKIELVKGKIDTVNGMNKEELKEYYKQSRLNSVISDVGGAGLGFIDMARKSGNKMNYKFCETSNERSLFILHNTITNN